MPRDDSYALDTIYAARRKKKEKNYILLYISFVRLMSFVVISTRLVSLVILLESGVTHVGVCVFFQDRRIVMDTGLYDRSESDLFTHMVGSCVDGVG